MARLSDASEGTIKWHELILRRWRLITGSPPLATVTTLTLACFRDSLRRLRGEEGKPLSPNTVRGYLAFIHDLLSKAGPPGPHNRDAAGWIPFAPWCKPPRKLIRPVVTLSNDQFDSRTFLRPTGGER